MAKKAKSTRTIQRLEDLTPDDRNANKGTERGTGMIEKSLRNYGAGRSILADRDGKIIAGNKTLEGCVNAGIEKIRVVQTDGNELVVVQRTDLDLRSKAARELAIVDNRAGQVSLAWDGEELQRTIDEFGIDLAEVGFADGELEDLIGESIEPGQTDPDDIPDPPDAAITQPGDLWILGEHRLLCGDSRDPDQVDRLLDGQKIQLVNTDPPYNVKVEPRSNNAIAAGLSSFQATHHQQGDLTRHPEKEKPTQRKLRAKDRPLANDFVTDSEFDDLLDAWFGNISRVLEPGCGFYIWGGYANCANYPPFLRKHGLYFSQAIIWVKQHPVLTRKDFMGNHEWCFYGWREGAAHRYFGPANAPDVWSIKKVNPQSMIHLTEKPVALAVRAMQYSSRPGENVLDLFGGSGSTMIAAEDPSTATATPTKETAAGRDGRRTGSTVIAAEQTRRHAYLMELDPLYCDIIAQRWQNFTGGTPKRIPAAGGGRGGKKATSRRGQPRKNGRAVN